MVISIISIIIPIIIKVIIVEKSTHGRAAAAKRSASSGSADNSSTSLAVLLSESLFLSTNPATEYSTSPAKWLTEKQSGRSLCLRKWLLLPGRPSPNSF